MAPLSHKETTKYETSQNFALSFEQSYNEWTLEKSEKYSS